MTQTSNTNYDAINKLLAKKVQYIIEFSGISEKFINQISDEIPDIKPLIVRPPEALEQKVEDLKGKSSIANISIQILDFKNTSAIHNIIKFISENDTLGRDATISVGYVGLVEGDFLPVMTGRVTDYFTNTDSSVFTFIIEDLLRTFIKNIFLDATKDSTVVIRDNPINLLLQIMTSTGNGTNGIYDVLPAGWGLNIDQSLVDIAEYEKIRDFFVPTDIEFEFETKKPVKAIDFMEKELYKPFNMNPIVKRDGKISLITDFPKLEIEPPIPFDEDTILGIPDWDGGIDRLVNEVHISMDWDEIAGEFRTEKFFIDATSQVRFQRSEEFEIKAKGIHGANSLTGDLDGDQLARNIALTIFSIRNIPLPIITFDSFFFRSLTEVGDQAEVTHSLIPDFRRGVRGITTEAFKVVNFETNFREGKVVIEAVQTGYSGKKFGAISTSAIVNSDETPSTTVFAVDTGHDFVAGDAIQIFTDELEDERAITSIDDSTGGGGGSNNKITISPALTRAPNVGDLVQYATSDFVESDGNTVQEGYAFMSEETAGTIGTIQASPAPTTTKFTVDDASGFAPSDLIKVKHGATKFNEFGNIYGIVGNQIELSFPLGLVPSTGETIVPEELEGGTQAFVLTPSIGVNQ